MTKLEQAGHSVVIHFDILLAAIVAITMADGENSEA